MRTEKSIMSNETLFCDDGIHRLLLRKKWDNEKPSAMVIMINPNSADNLNMDMTTMLVVNNLNKLDFGSVDIVNLYTRIVPKIHFRFNSDEDLLWTIVKKVDRELEGVKSFSRIGQAIKGY